MRLSELLKQGGGTKAGGALGSRNAAPTSATLVPPQPFAAEAPEPFEKPAVGAVATAAASSSSLYEALPPAIMEAAKQLNIKPSGTPDNEVFAAAVDKLETIFSGLLAQDKEKTGLANKTRGIVSDLEAFVALEPNVARLMQLNPPAESALAWHSVNTALLAIDLAKLAPRGECSVADIGIAALLHDTGLLNAKRTANWNPADRKYKEHVAASVDIVAKMGFPVLIQKLIIQHHERMDGSGFPKGLKAGEIHPAAQIIGLADAVEHLVSGHEGKVLADRTDYVQTSLQLYRNYFHPEVLKALVALRGFYPVGSLVELNNRSICLVVRQNEGQPLRPVVQVVMDGSGNHPESTKIVDLRNSPAVAILRSVASAKA